MIIHFTHTYGIQRAIPWLSLSCSHSVSPLAFISGVSFDICVLWNSFSVELICYALAIDNYSIEFTFFWSKWFWYLFHIFGNGNQLAKLYALWYMFDRKKMSIKSFSLTKFNHVPTHFWGVQKKLDPRMEMNIKTTPNTRIIGSIKQIFGKCNFDALVLTKNIFGEHLIQFSTCVV